MISSTGLVTRLILPPSELPPRLRRCSILLPELLWY